MVPSLMKRFFFSFALFVTVALPMSSVEAAFVPCGTSESDTPCTLCHIVIMGKGIMDWGMQVMVAIGLVVITAMGIMYIVSAGDEGRIKNAKSGIKTSLIGVSVMLGAWLIVNTLLLLVAQETDASKNPIVGLYTTNGYTFSCVNQSASGGALRVPVAPHAQTLTRSRPHYRVGAPSALAGVSLVRPAAIRRHGTV